MEDDRLLYISLYDKDENTIGIWVADTWSEHLLSSNKSFEKNLKTDQVYERSCGKMFLIWKDNLRWHIDKLQENDRHFFVEYSVL